MRKVGLIFGSFNPIHNAHIRIGELAIDSGVVDEVWFVIAKQNPFKDNYGVDFNDRERMVGIALMETDCSWTLACDFAFAEGNTENATLMQCMNNYQEDGTVKVPEILWPYMGGTKVLEPKKK